MLVRAAGSGARDDIAERLEDWYGEDDMFDFHQYLKDRIHGVEECLDRRLPPASARPAVLHEAMRYSVFAGGKRLRPVLCLAAAEAVGGAMDQALLPAAAIELLHTYTLIHDDLPAMDNDALRRGKPTCHVAFGEANAILAGDALLTLAFEWMACCSAPPPYQPNQFALELAEAAGSRGVIAGQVEDLAAEGKPTTPDAVEFIHLHKTAVLFRAAARIGAMAGRAKESACNALTIYGGDLGLAFQIVDDLLNVTSSPEALGKAVGSDQQRGKATWVSIHGVEAARHRAERLVEQAVSRLEGLRGPVEPLRALAHYAIHREC